MLISRASTASINKQNASLRNKLAVVDDERDLAELFGDAIKTLDYTVELYTDSLFASETIAAQHSNYVLVLSDVRMPGLSGIEPANYLSRIDPQIKIMLTTAFESIEQSRFECIQKPILITKLIKIVREHVGIRTMPIQPVDTLTEIQQHNFYML